MAFFKHSPGRVWENPARAHIECPVSQSQKRILTAVAQVVPALCVPAAHRAEIDAGSGWLEMRQGCAQLLLQSLTRSLVAANVE